MLQKILLSFASILIFSSTSAQDWINKMYDPTVNFYDVKKEFNAYWQKQQRKEKFKSFFIPKKNHEEGGEGYVQYKRWEYFVEQRVYPSGDRSLLANTAIEQEKFAASPTLKGTRQAGGNWQPLGSFGSPSAGGGAGRLNCVRFHPTNTNILYAGAPVGGLWISTNNGTSWTTNTDNLPSLGVSDVAVDPTNPNIMYLGTGDFDGSDCYGVGVLKSIDAGQTWHMTGLNFSLSQGRYISRILINPTNHNIIIAATSSGIYRTTDAGVTWVRVLLASNIRDLEFKPNDPSIVYATNATLLFKSTNSGLTFATISAGLPLTSVVSRVAIAVTPADPNYLYLVYADKVTNGFRAVYRSIDAGTTFTLQASSPNLLGWDSNGNDSDGQAWYTLSIAASPLNKNEIVVGGVNIWRSTNGGVSWNINAHWYGGGAPYVHADIHDLTYKPNSSTYYASSDGGVFVTTNGGISWTDKSNGMQIGQMYKLGCSVTNANLVTQGWQDNGTNKYSSGTWSQILGGDGMETFVDWSNPSYIYATTQNGDLNISSDGGNSFSGIGWGISEPGQWVTPWLQHPTNSQTIFAGYENVWKSTDRGNSWSKISTFNSSGLKALAISKSNPSYIYASNGATVYRTSNGGSSWTALTIPSGGSNFISYIEVSATNPLKIWITRSGYGINNKVYKSIDGGATWINLSANLPNIPINCVASQSGSVDGIYVGTDLGIYYIDNTMTSWMSFSNGLPNVVVTELEIHAATSKLRAATYGRGLWESSVFNATSLNPYPNFTANVLSGCPGLVVQFSDSTTKNPTSWKWYFQGGTPSTSTLKNPSVTYNVPGTYNAVKLVATNSSGTDSLTKLSYIAISTQAQPTILLDNNDSLCAGQTVKLTSSNSNSFLWHPGNQVLNTLTVNATGTYSVTVTDVYGCTTTSSAINIYVFPMPTPIITQSADTLYSSAATGNQWYLNTVLIPGATNNFYKTNGIGGNYTVIAKNIMGCASSASAPFAVGINEYNTTEIDFTLFPNPAQGAITLALQSDIVSDVKISISDVLGKEVYSNSFVQFTGQKNVTLNLSEYKTGIYFLTISNSKGSSSKKMVVY